MIFQVAILRDGSRQSAGLTSDLQNNAAGSQLIVNAKTPSTVKLSEEEVVSSALHVFVDASPAAYGATAYARYIIISKWIDF